MTRVGDAGVTTETLSELMVANQGGEAMVFEKLYAGLAGPVLGYLRSLTRDAGQAGDLLQETFLRVQRAMAELRRLLALGKRFRSEPEGTKIRLSMESGDKKSDVTLVLKNMV